MAIRTAGITAVAVLATWPQALHVQGRWIDDGKRSLGANRPKRYLNLVGKGWEADTV